MPRFIAKFLGVIEMQADSTDNNDLGKKARDLLGRFLEDLHESTSRSLFLDREVITKLHEFLDKCDESKRISTEICLKWLEKFIYFFKTDF
jgi:hypothetical protein